MYAVLLFNQLFHKTKLKGYTLLRACTHVETQQWKLNWPYNKAVSHEAEFSLRKDIFYVSKFNFLASHSPKAYHVIENKLDCRAIASFLSVGHYIIHQSMANFR